MYIGQKEAHTTFEVPVELCYEVKRNSETWIEIFIPDRNTKTMWNSFLVKPKQVYFLTQQINLIEDISPSKPIKCFRYSEDKKGNRKVVPSKEEQLTPNEIKKRIDFYVYMKSYK